MGLDETDRTILEHLQKDARTPFSEIARQIGVSSATIHDRVNKLEDAGVIEGYHATLNPDKLGYSVSAIVGLQVKQGHELDTLDCLKDIEGIQEFHLTTGSWDVLLRVYANDTEQLRELVFEHILQMEALVNRRRWSYSGRPTRTRDFPSMTRISNHGTV